MANASNVRAFMAEILEQPPSALTDEMPLDSLVVGSFTLVEMIIAMQEQFGVHFTHADMAGVATVGDLIALFGDRAERAAA